MVTLFQRPPATTALVEAGAPPWAQRMVLKFFGYFVPILPVEPGRIWRVIKADLPPADAWPGCLALVVDQNCLAVSQGGVWLRIDLGGPV
jgi:hypothetical protein